MRFVAMPVFEENGEVPGGIAISGPSSRFDMKHLQWLRDIALEHARALSQALGGIG
jgi:DNA-binding IclR family transcriptional regulator